MADTYKVERKIRVDAPASAVYERIVDFHRWPAWSPFEELDPGMDRTYAGAESGVGAVYEWSGSLRAGAGRMEIVDAVDDQRVMIDQRNRKPFRRRPHQHRRRRSSVPNSLAPHSPCWLSRCSTQASKITRPMLCCSIPPTKPYRRRLTL